MLHGPFYALEMARDLMVMVMGAGFELLNFAGLACQSAGRLSSTSVIVFPKIWA